MLRVGGVLSISGGGASPNPENENDLGGDADFARVQMDADSCVESCVPLLPLSPILEDDVGTAASVDFAETSNCSPSSFNGISDNSEASLYSSRATGLGGYPCFRSKLVMDVLFTIEARRSAMVAPLGRMILVWPDGPRIRIRIATDDFQFPTSRNKRFLDQYNEAVTLDSPLNVSDGTKKHTQGEE